MDGIPAIYLGRMVSKENFRAFIYAPDGSQKLVESWDEFEACMQSGIWFATAEDANSKIGESQEEKPKKQRVSRNKKVEFIRPEVQEDVLEEEVLIEEGIIIQDAVFEVMDDFLPKDA